jgi:hypothetical protein
MTRPEKEFDSAKILLASGMSAYEVGRRLGIPRGTVQRWSRREIAPSPQVADASRWSVTDPERYCYVLGVYLGDGHITHRPPRGWTLRIFCDEQYAAVAAEVSSSLESLFPDVVVRRIAASSGRCEVISVSHPAIGIAFPQHGPGRKHERAIVLTDWQRKLTHAHPGALVRGLIHSDGCRTVNRVTTTLPSGRAAEYEYVRYFFTNHSADIREIFIEHCALLGVRVTQSNPRNLSVSRRDGVAVLEELVGPKR